jgi:AcrR family transcriptional regulator
MGYVAHFEGVVSIMSRTDEPTRLTAKGRATRERIVGIAADLIHENGVLGTTNDDVRRAAGISGSQLSHYFPDKESLVRAVIAWWADRVVSLTRRAPSGRLDSMDALRQWAAFYVEREDAWQRGCKFGSLASEVIKSDLGLKGEIAAGFGQWQAAIAGSLAAMRDRGDLRDDADPGRLACLLLAAYQGGMLLAQAERSVTPLMAALDGAIDHISTFNDERLDQR